MRPPRIAILALFFAASVFLFCRSIVAVGRTHPVITTPTPTPVEPQPSQLRSLFSLAPIWSIFPPNAQISLTDDNSTFFPARPAAFGPPLPANGLSGQLWIGSGFAEDNLQGGENQGELGCSDIPGWDDGPPILAIKNTKEALLRAPKLSSTASKPKNSKRGGPAHGPLVDRTAKEATPQEKTRAVDDGTDDYLHQGLQSTHKSLRDSVTSGSAHADIQSIQETAEITGKVVLLKRGGCGFFEKVKWAQRRGATAVIVGDNTKGGPLIQMWARWDTSHITIPSVFTAHTTAHLLSSLMQPGSFIEDIIDENGRAAQKVQQFDGGRKKAAVATNAKAATSSRTKEQTTQNTGAKSDPHIQRRTWLSRFFGWSADSSNNVNRAQNKGRLNWVLVDEWNDEKDKVIKSSLEKASREGSGNGQLQTSGDGFQIGVHDWRDPDLVGGAAVGSVNVVDGKAGPTAVGKPKDMNGPKGGSITPGSGEYTGQETPGGTGTTNPAGSTDTQPGIMSKIFGDDDNIDSSPAEPPADTAFVPGFQEYARDGAHEGLWVTITPTSSATPFFDTLLILVISPLITLSVVYSLLILRARIRRRRWRAPKSVVEQLPVRTYHTVAASGAHSPRLPSPSSASPATPLLQGSTSRPRPRSRTTTGIPDAGHLLRVDSALENLSRPPSRGEGEKHGNMPSSWKKYMGRQVECVVCLEEYIDGVSRVMGLPCGHEFHADCITPWLTTRRRTCPICKGDVVRSLARGVPSSPRYEAYRDDSDDDVRALQRRNSDRNVSPSPRDDDDVEQGYLTPTQGGRNRRAATPGDTWFSNIFSSSFGSIGSSSRMGRRTPPDEDRDR